VRSCLAGVISGRGGRTGKASPGKRSATVAPFYPALGIALPGVPKHHPPRRPMRSLLPRSPKNSAGGSSKDSAGGQLWVAECGVRGSAAAARCGGAGREWARVGCGACGATEDAGSHVMRLHVARISRFAGFFEFFFAPPAAVTKSQSQPARDISTDASPDGWVASCFLCGVLFCGPLATAMCSKLPGRPCARVPTGACQHTRLCQHLKGKWPRPRACPCAGLECQIPLKIQRKGSSGAQKGACS